MTDACVLLAPEHTLLASCFQGFARSAVLVSTQPTRSPRTHPGCQGQQGQTFTMDDVTRSHHGGSSAEGTPHTAPEWHSQHSHQDRSGSTLSAGSQQSPSDHLGSSGRKTNSHGSDSGSVSESRPAGRGQEQQQYGMIPHQPQFGYNQGGLHEPDSRYGQQHQQLPNREYAQQQQQQQQQQAPHSDSCNRGPPNYEAASWKHRLPGNGGDSQAYDRGQGSDGYGLKQHPPMQQYQQPQYYPPPPQQQQYHSDGFQGQVSKPAYPPQQQRPYDTEQQQFAYSSAQRLPPHLQQQHNHQQTELDQQQQQLNEQLRKHNQQQHDHDRRQHQHDQQQRSREQERQRHSVHPNERTQAGEGGPNARHYVPATNESKLVALNDCWSACGVQLAQHLEVFTMLTKSEDDAEGRTHFKKQNNYLLKVLFDNAGECAYHADCILRTFKISKGRLKRLQERIKREIRGEHTRHGLYGRPSNNRKKGSEAEESVTALFPRADTAGQSPDTDPPLPGAEAGQGGMTTSNGKRKRAQRDVTWKRRVKVLGNRAVDMEDEGPSEEEDGSTDGVSMGGGSLGSSSRGKGNSTASDSGLGSVPGGSAHEARQKHEKHKVPKTAHPVRSSDSDGSSSQNVVSPELD